METRRGTRSSNGLKEERYGGAVGDMKEEPMETEDSFNGDEEFDYSGLYYSNKYNSIWSSLWTDWRTVCEPFKKPMQHVVSPGLSAKKGIKSEMKRDLSSMDDYHDVF